MSADPNGQPLTEAELKFASILRMTPTEYAALKTIRDHNDWVAYDANREKGGGVEQRYEQ